MDVQLRQAYDNGEHRCRSWASRADRALPIHENCGEETGSSTAEVGDSVGAGVYLRDVRYRMIFRSGGLTGNQEGDMTARLRLRSNV